jgi:hypothetical protein
MDATIGFGLGAMHKVVLGPTQIITQLESSAHSHRRRLSLSTMILHVKTAVGMNGRIKQHTCLQQLSLAMATDVTMLMER